MELTFFSQLFLILFTIIFAVVIICYLLPERLVHNVREKYILITGCDSGFGKLLAQSLDQDGARVLAACLTEKGQRELQESSSDKLQTLKLDVTNPDQIEQAVLFVKNSLPANTGLWGLVNNAGVIRNAPFDWMTDQDIKFVVDINVWGVVNVTKAFLPMLKKGKGRIVNVASVAGRFCFPYFSAYCISKFAVEALSDCLRLEMKPFEVSVHIIEPALFKTPLTNSENVKKDIEKMWNQASENTKKEYGEVFLKKVYKFVRVLADRALPHPEYVCEAMRHALLSARPKHRYQVGWRLVTYILMYFPTWITDSFYSKWPYPDTAK